MRLNSVYRALAKNGLAEERGVGQFALHGEGLGEKIVGRVLAKGWLETRWASRFT